MSFLESLRAHLTPGARRYNAIARRMHALEGLPRGELQSITGGEEGLAWAEQLAREQLRISGVAEPTEAELELALRFSLAITVPDQVDRLIPTDPLAAPLPDVDLVDAILLVDQAARQIKRRRRRPRMKHRKVYPR